MKLLLDHVTSPIGTLLLVSDSESLCALDFRGFDERMQRHMRRRFGDDTQFAETEDPQGFSTQMRAYFDGDLGAINDIPVSTGGTAFQQLVWAALRDIPTGTTETYGQLAARLGKPMASRAVGLANGRNPVAIVVPCHRVIGANGALTGYGGGLDRKRWLLKHERATPDASECTQMALSLS